MKFKSNNYKRKNFLNAVLGVVVLTSPLYSSNSHAVDPVEFKRTCTRAGMFGSSMGEAQKKSLLKEIATLLKPVVVIDGRTSGQKTIDAADDLSKAILSKISNTFGAQTSPEINSSDSVSKSTSGLEMVSNAGAWMIVGPDSDNQGHYIENGTQCKAYDVIERLPIGDVRDLLSPTDSFSVSAADSGSVPAMDSTLSATGTDPIVHLIGDLVEKSQVLQYVVNLSDVQMDDGHHEFKTNFQIVMKLPPSIEIKIPNSEDIEPLYEVKELGLSYYPDMVRINQDKFGNDGPLMVLKINAGLTKECGNSRNDCQSKLVLPKLDFYFTNKIEIKRDNGGVNIIPESDTKGKFQLITRKVVNGEAIPQEANDQSVTPKLTSAMIAAFTPRMKLNIDHLGVKIENSSMIVKKESSTGDYVEVSADNAEFGTKVISGYYSRLFLGDDGNDFFGNGIYVDLFNDDIKAYRTDLFQSSFNTNINYFAKKSINKTNAKLKLKSLVAQDAVKSAFTVSSDGAKQQALNISLELSKKVAEKLIKNIDVSKVTSALGLKPE